MRGARYGVVGWLVVAACIAVDGCAEGAALTDDDASEKDAGGDATTATGSSSSASGGVSSGSTASSASSSSGGSSNSSASSTSSSSSSGSSSSSASSSSSSSGGPSAAWRCFQSAYDDGFRCDCGCGERDPDCNTNNAFECDTCDEFNCFATSFEECKANLDPFDNGVCQ